MKLLKVITGAVFMISLMSPLAMAAKEAKIAYVDLSRLFDEYHKTQTFDKTLENEHKAFEAERNAKIEKIQEQQGKLGLLTDDKKAKIEEEIEKMKADLLEFDRQKKEELTKDRNDKIREILLEIEKSVSEYAEKEEYAIILNDRVLIYGQQSIDLTDKIIVQLNGEKAK